MVKKEGKIKKEVETSGPAGAPSLPGGFPTMPDLIAMIGIFLAATLVGWLIMIILHRTDMDRGLITVIYYSVQFALAILGIFLYRRSRGAERAVFHFSVKWYNASLVLLGIVLILAVSIVIEPLLNLFPDHYFEHLDRAIGRGGWSILLTVALAPVFEEMLFRGLILESARQKWGATTAIMISALFFGLVHMPNLPQALNAFVMGVIMGYIYVLTDSLLSVIIIHAVNNGLAYLIMEITGTQASDLRSIIGNDMTYWVIYGVCLIIFVVSLVAMAMIATERMRKRAEIAAVFNKVPGKETLPEESGENNNKQ